MADGLKARTDFSGVFKAELDYVCSYRDGLRRNTESLREAAATTDKRMLPLTGVALSGGGIRSAAFALGVLQALAANGLLHLFDYVSAVSGGGYIAGWLARWVHSRKSFRTVVEDLGSPAARPEPDFVTWIRGHSSFLTPRTSLFGHDVSLFIATYVRNLACNLVTLLLLCGALLLIPRGVLGIGLWLTGDSHGAYVCRVLGGALALIAVTSVVWTMGRERCREIADESPRVELYVAIALAFAVVLTALFLALAHFGYYPHLIETIGAYLLLLPVAIALSRLESSGRARQYSRRVVWVALFAGFIISSSMLRQAKTRHLGRQLPYAWDLLRGLGEGHPWLSSMVVASSLLCFYAVTRQRLLARFTRVAASRLFLGLRTALAVGVVVLACVFFVYRGQREVAYLYDAITRDGEPFVLSTVFLFRWPMYTLLGGLAFNLLVALLGTVVPRTVRDTTAGLTGRLAVSTLIWVCLASVSIVAPFALTRTGGSTHLVAALWCTAVLAGFAVRRPVSIRNRLLRRLAGALLAAAPYVVVLGFLSGASVATNAYFFRISTSNANYWQKTLATYSLGTWIAAAILLLLAALASWRFGENRTSLHEFYEARLRECFLNISLSHDRKDPPPAPPQETAPAPPADRAGAQNRRVGRNADPDWCLHDLIPEGADQGTGGPYLLLNAALNLVAEHNLLWQERKGASFVFSPIYCGFEPAGTMVDAPKWHLAREGYRLSSAYTCSKDRGIPLSAAMAISGSAIATNMGYRTSPRIRFLHTLFNLRLGVWFPNPRHDYSWRAVVPRSRLNLLWKEFMGRTDDSHPYVYLTDGGHFENLGLYELVRRRCRLIVVCDASEDREGHFRDLGMAVERCRIDFGVEVKVPYTELHEKERRGVVRPVAFGTIEYPEPSGRRSVGVLVYLKPTLLGDEPVDVRSFACVQHDFPHHSTAEQWFLESHFESYRALGFHIGERFAKPIRDEFGDPEMSISDEVFFRAVKRKAVPDARTAGTGE